MTARVTAQRFRQRKLSTKQNLPVLRENEVEKTADEEAQRHIPKVETGVEKGEEIEHHLQAVISASQAAAVGGKIAHLYIPTPEAIASSLKYEDVYPRHFQQPATYIRFSSTVEDCVGCPYSMTTDDDAFLKTLNAKRSNKNSQCAEDQFEQVMDFFEEQAGIKQPYAAVDNTSPVPFEEMEAAYDETIEESSRKFAKDIYDHWLKQRIKRGNRPLSLNLKFETNLETDDSDPYVCFRRREVRQARKTRGRDAQVTEKLKKLRGELEIARHLISMLKQREHFRKDQLAIDKLIFEQRMQVKEVKRNLGITSREGEEDLVNQKPSPKPSPKIETSMQRSMPGAALRSGIARMDPAPETNLISLQETLAKRDEEAQRFIEDSKAKHRAWNKGFVDITWRPITPPIDDVPRSSYRTAVPEYLPTPPASVSSEHSGDNLNADENATPRAAKEESQQPVVRYASPPLDTPRQGRPGFRRRMGRGGRLFVDRRGVKRPATEPIEDQLLDRYKYDRESSDDDQVYPVDTYDDAHMLYRVRFDKPQITPQRLAAQQMKRLAANGNVHVDSSGHFVHGPPGGGRRTSIQLQHPASNGSG